MYGIIGWRMPRENPHRVYQCYQCYYTRTHRHTTTIIRGLCVYDRVYNIHFNMVRLDCCRKQKETLAFLRGSQHHRFPGALWLIVFRAKYYIIYSHSTHTHTRGLRERCWRRVAVLGGQWVCRGGRGGTVVENWYSTSRRRVYCRGVIKATADIVVRDFRWIIINYNTRKTGI